MMQTERNNRGVHLGRIRAARAGSTAVGAGRPATLTSEIRLNSTAGSTRRTSVRAPLSVTVDDLRPRTRDAVQKPCPYLF